MARGRDSAACPSPVAQASVIAFEKVFLVMGVTFICALPLLLGFRTGRTQGGGVPH